MTKRVYIEATYRALQNGTDTDKVISGLKAVLARHGHSLLYKAILENVALRIQKDEAKKVTHITVARPQDVATYQQEIENFSRNYGAEKTEVIVDESIVGGFVAQTQTHRTDRSYKESLLSIYKSLTAH